MFYSLFSIFTLFLYIIHIHNPSQVMDATSALPPGKRMGVLSKQVNALEKVDQLRVCIKTMSHKSLR